MSRRPWARTLPDLIREWTSLTPDAIAVIPSEGVPLSYSDLDRMMSKIAAALAHRGIGPGTTVGLLAPNIAEWIPTALAVQATCARLAAFNTFVKPLELTYLLEHSQCTALIIADRVGKHSLLGTLKDVLPELWDADPTSWHSTRFPHLRTVVVIGPDRPPGAESWSDLLAGQSDDQLPTGNHPSAVDDAVVVYTSGSTARPKAVPLAHYGMIENGFAIGERMGLTPKDRVWLGSPLFWSYGVANAMVATFTHGAALVLQAEYSPVAAAELIARERCTAAYLLPTLLHDWTSLPPEQKAKLSSLQTGLTIGRPDEVALALDLGIGGICNVYGATEVYGNCCVTPRDMPIESRLTCQGPPLEGVAIRITDPTTGGQVSEGEGLIEVRGYTTRGYLGEPELNAKTFTADGWYKTGDLGVLLADGSLQFVARATDMIKTSGINVSPAEVEEFINSHEDVAACVVVGVGDVQRGEIVVAIVQPVSGRQLDSQELISHCKKNIAAYKVPTKILVVEQIPTTATGKIARMEVRRLVEEASR